jgi:hypothetical protein
LVFLLILTTLLRPFGFLADFNKSARKPKGLNKAVKVSKKTKGPKQGSQNQQENERASRR